jgi:hypothetical protein
MRWKEFWSRRSCQYNTQCFSQCLRWTRRLLYCERRARLSRSRTPVCALANGLCSFNANRTHSRIQTIILWAFSRLMFFYFIILKLLPKRSGKLRRKNRRKKSPELNFRIYPEKLWKFLPNKSKFLVRKNKKKNEMRNMLILRPVIGRNFPKRPSMIALNNDEILPQSSNEF